MTACRSSAPCGAPGRALPEPHRAAVYYAPEVDDPLWAAGCAWLGRDPESGATLPQPGAPDIAPLTADPRRYGFHATLKAPMALRHGLDAFVHDVMTLAAGTTSFALAPLAVTDLHGFLALCTAAPCPAMDALAADCVMLLDRHREPEDDAAQARRAADRTPRQVGNVALWGYPLVMEDFLFHMTLTAAALPNPLLAAAQTHFAGVLAPRRVSSLAVFVEDAPGAPFRLSHRLPLAIG